MLSLGVASLALLGFAAAFPAGGPQGQITYPVGTVIQIAVLQPSGNDFMASNYNTDPNNNAAFIKTDPSDTSPVVNLITTNATDAAGYTGVAMQDPAYGLELTDSGVVVSPGAQMDKFYLVSGTLRNADAPDGFYYCDADSPSLGQPDVGRISFAIANTAPQGCYQAAFVTFW